MRLYEQLEGPLVPRKWGQCENSTHRSWVKRQKRRVERHRAKSDPECQPLYRKYKGWEW